jgi:hypothetical protein
MWDVLMNDISLYQKYDFKFFEDEDFLYLHYFYFLSKDLENGDRIQSKLHVLNSLQINTPITHHYISTTTIKIADEEI